MMLGLGIGLWSNVAATSGGGAAWTPLSLGSALAAWYDADQQSESADAAVATFVDRSGHGNDFVQATGVTQPLLRYAAINGKKAIDFDGINDQMECHTGLLNGATAGSFFAVIKLDADPPPGGGPILDGFSSNAASNSSFHPFNDGNIYDIFGITVRNTCGNPTPSLASTALIGAIAGAGDYRFLVNNTTLFSTAGSTIGFGTGIDYGSGAARAMGRTAPIAAVNFLAGLVAEVIVTNAVPSAGDLTNLVSYVNTKFGTSF